MKKIALMIEKSKKFSNRKIIFNSYNTQYLRDLSYNILDKLGIELKFDKYKKYIAKYVL